MKDLAADDVIIMVDDDENDTYVAKVCFDRSTLGRTWISFHAPEDFLAHLHEVKVGHAPMPSAVLLDINMPGMNGFEVLRAVRADRFFAERPEFIVLTTSDDGLDHERAEALGARRVVTKPDSIAEYVRFFDSLAPAPASGPPLPEGQS